MSRAADFNPDRQPHWSSTPYLQQFVKSDGIGTLRVCRHAGRRAGRHAGRRAGRHAGRR